MAKFIDKKERVYDLKLTTYGKYLLSIGSFEPKFYAFFDKNIIYDGAYAQLSESQNNIQHRIKNETQYLESLVLFEEIEDPLKHSAVEIEDFDVDGDGEIEEDIDSGYTESALYFKADITPTMRVPRKNTFRYAQAIGDSFLDGAQQIAPAWKVVTLDGNISSSSPHDIKNDIHNIPQINVSLDYKKRIENYDPNGLYTEEALRNSVGVSKKFGDDKVIRFVSQDFMVYIEELNTDILSENFDIEIFEIDKDAIPDADGTKSKDKYTRKYFPVDHERIMGGLLTEKSLDYVDPISTDVRNIDFNYTTNSVGYYFDIYKDYQVDHDLACKAIEVYNKQSYYIDLDFDCSMTTKEDPVYIDIYGPATEPEVCP